MKIDWDKLREKFYAEVNKSGFCYESPMEVFDWFKRELESKPSLSEEDVKSINNEIQRQNALKAAEDNYNNPLSPHYRDNERFTWAVETINKNYLT